MAARLDRVERGAQRRPARHLDLRPHQVEPGDPLGDRMLDLQPGVHLQEVELAGAVEQELHRAGVGVADRRRGPHRRLAHAPPQLRRDHRRRRLLDHLLVAPLQRALALAERHQLAVLVAEDLDLDVPRPLEELLDVDPVVGEAGARLGARRPVGGGQPVRRADPAHALAAAAGRRLEHHRVADPLGEPRRLVEAGQRLVAAGDHRHPSGAHPPAALDLRPHGRHRRRRRADEHQAGIGAHRGELGVLGQEAVAGVDGVGADLARQLDDRLGAQVALGRGGGADRMGLVGQHHRQAAAVGLRVDHRAADPQLAQGAQDAHRDLAPVGDQDLAQGALAAGWRHLARARGGGMTDREGDGRPLGGF